MARFSGGWAPIPRKYISITRDILDRAILTTLFWWANPETSFAPNGKSKIEIQRGELKTSWDELAEELRTDRRIIKRRCEKFAIAEILTIRTEGIYRGCIIKCLDYPPKKIKKVTKNGRADGIGFGRADGIPQTIDTQGIADSAGHDMVGHYGHDMDTYLINKNLTKKNKKGGEGEAALAAEEPPSFKSLEELEIGNGIEKAHISPVDKKEPPEEANALLIRWEGYAQKTCPNTPFKRFREMSAIMKMAEISSYAELSQVLTLLENPIDEKLIKLSHEFKLPSQFSKAYYDEGSRFDVVIKFAREILNKKEIQRKKEELETDKKAKRDAMFTEPRTNRSFTEEFKKVLAGDTEYKKLKLLQ